MEDLEYTHNDMYDDEEEYYDEEYDEEEENDEEENDNTDNSIDISDLLYEPEEVEHLIIIDPKNMPDIDMYYGHWQMYLFNKSEDEYMPTDDYFIFYKGRFFNDMKSKPMTENEVEKIQLIANIYNKGGYPICVFRKEKNI